MAKAKEKITEAEAPETEKAVETAVESVHETAEEPESTSEDFVMRKLRIINGMENQAKAQRLANRLLRKRK